MVSLIDFLEDGFVVVTGEFLNAHFELFFGKSEERKLTFAEGVLEEHTVITNDLSFAFDIYKTLKIARSAHIRIKYLPLKATPRALPIWPNILVHSRYISE